MNHAQHILDHTLAIQRIEYWSPTDSQYNDLLALTKNELKPAAFFHTYINKYCTPETTAYRKPLFSRYDPYLISGKNILKNNFKIVNQEALTNLEYLCSAARIIELYKRVAAHKVLMSSLEIPSLHAAIFGDVYPWAGYYRTVGIAKNDSYFAAPKIIPIDMIKITQRSRFVVRKNITKEEMIRTFSRLYANYNYLHPFREGNGRTGMTWLEFLAFTLGWHITFNNITQKEWHLASQHSMPAYRASRPDPGPIAELLFNNIIPLDYSPGRILLSD